MWFMVRPLACYKAARLIVMELRLASCSVMDVGLHKELACACAHSAGPWAAIHYGGEGCDQHGHATDIRLCLHAAISQGRDAGGRHGRAHVWHAAQLAVLSRGQPAVRGPQPAPARRAGAAGECLKLEVI